MTSGVVTNRIIVRLKQRAQGKPGSRTARQRQEEAARNARVNKMLISMVVIFGISWCPINLINLAADTVDLSSLSTCAVRYKLQEIHFRLLGALLLSIFHHSCHSNVLHLL